MLGIAAASPGAAVEDFGSVSITSFPGTIAIGDTVTINGFVSGQSGVDVTVRLYTLPRCASGPVTRTVLTTASDGTFTFTETLCPPPTDGGPPDAATSD